MRYRTPPADSNEDEVLEMSIVGDEEEQQRIELEHNLQDLSIQLSLSAPSSASDAEAHGKRSLFNGGESETSLELEYPRHNPHPRDVSIFDGHASVHPFSFGQDYDNSYNHLSRQSLDEEYAGPYLGNTKSSMAHHTSAVTLSAGLKPHRRRGSHFGDASLSGAEYDPDRPLDNVLKMANDLSLLHMDTPRAQRKQIINVVSEKKQSKLRPAVNTDNYEGNSHIFQGYQTAAKTNQNFTKSTTHKMQPSVKRAQQEHVPTPSTVNGTGGSKFTKLAKGLAKEIEASQRWITETTREPISPGRRKRAPQKPKKNILHNAASRANVSFARSCTDQRRVSNPSHEDTKRIRNAKPSTSIREIVLPDVTGLTSVLASPVKPGIHRRPYLSGHDDEQIEDQLFHTLKGLQSRLNQLESQNLVSRRRVRELELELEACKVEVKRERTRVLEREQIIIAQQKDFQKKQKRNSTKRSTQPEQDLNLDDRYNEVVEEKKALEALIGTLRTHLARLTEELSSQQEQLNDLRTLRESDIRDLREKITEVDTLKLEIERLGGEVEILRGVVEEGLKERRRVKEAIDGDEGEFSRVSLSVQSVHEADISSGLRSLTYDRSRVEIPSPPPSRPQTPENTGPRFIDDEELERVSADLDERRSEVSIGNSRDRSLESTRLVPEPTEEVRKPKNEKGKSRAFRARIADIPSPMANTVYAKTPVHPPVTQISRDESPFPQIRGTQLERLFFSAPEHNTKTCRVCHRRRPDEFVEELDFPSWLPPRKRCKFNIDDGGAHSRKEGEHLNSQTPFAEDRLPPQTVLVRVLRELEDDFTHYKSIYIELADQYKFIDAASNVAKRNVLAEHVKEVIDTLEQKGDQIASLYDLLSFKDKPHVEGPISQRNRLSRAMMSPRLGHHPKPNNPRKFAAHS